MAKRISFMIFLLPILLCSIISISEAFHSNANKDDTTADPNDQRPYRRENSTNPAGQGGYYGGHDTLTAEGILLKKDVHKNESDGGERFKTWAEQDALPWFRTGVHDEDSTKLWEVIPLSESPIGPNGPGDFRKHFYNPDTGEGLKGWETPTTTQALNYINELSNRYLCQPGMMNQLSPRDRSKMYDYLGRILHLVQDMGNPAHSRDDLHIYTKTFEDYVNDHWDEIVNSDDFKLAVTAPEYLKGNYENFSNKAHPIFYPDEFVKALANVSKDYPTDGLGIMSDEELQENVRFLIPETIKYTAGYIDAIYSFFKSTEQMGDINICKQLPQGYLNPGGGHPDDRFDVSDEFYWEKEFNLSDGELTDLYLRTAVKKGKIGVWYKKQYWTTFFDGRTAYKNAPHEVLDALEAKFQAIGKKLEQRPKSDWKGAPDIALFTNGFHNPSISLMLKIGEPVSFQGVDFDPEIVKDHPILLVPSAGFYGLSASDSVRAALDEYVKNGGILVAFSQQYGSDWSLLPTPDDPQTGSKKPVTGYGYQEDQNCQFNSVYVDTYHPILSGFSNSTASVGVDGYFLSYPENATVLLRRTANGQPAMILYPHGQGYVIATVLFTDFALTHNQANLAEIGLIQDMISWAKKPASLLEVKPGESVSLSMLVANHTDVEAASLKLIFLSPGREVIHEQPLTVAVPAGQSITVPASYTTPPSSALGIYHVDYILLDGQGNIIQPQAETDSGRFVVSNPPQKYTSDKPVLFSVTTSSQEVLFGTPLNYTFHVYNNTEEVRNLTLRSYFGHTGRDHEWKIAANPRSETTLSGTDIFIDSHWYFETLRSYLYDETMKLIGAYDLSFTGVLPSASITAQTEKKFYRQGETVPIHGLLKNNSPAAWQANIVVRVLNNNNVKIFEDTKAVSLSPLGTSPIGADFLLPQNAESGAYTVRMEARDGNILVHAAAGSFQVIRSQISVSPSLPSLLDSGAYMLVFGITNSGNVDVTAGVLKVNLKDPGGGTIYEAHQPFALPIGQSTTLNLTLNIPPAKFGTYFLTYTQTDETGDGSPATLPIFNNYSAVITFDKPFYKVRETANIALELRHTGNFAFGDVLLTIAVPDTGFTDTRNILLYPGQNLHFASSIPVPETITAGPHDVNVTATLPSGESLVHGAVFSVPESALVVSQGGSTNLNAGDTVNLKIENRGGKDTVYTTEKLLIADTTGAEIYRGGASGTLSAGEEKSLADIQVPTQSAAGLIFLDLAVKDGQNGRITNFLRTFAITGLTASLQIRTAKDSFFTTEPIAGLCSILNGPMGMEGGSLRVTVARRASEINGPFTHFLPAKGWWPFNNPRAVALGPTGSVYVADTSNHRIQKFDSNGNFILKWGSQGSEDGQFASPKGIAVGPDGSVYVADSDNQRIQKFDGNGNFVTKWGSSGSGEGQFDSLMGIAVDSEGWVYAADMRNNRIQKFDSLGNFSVQWGSYGSGNGQFYYPVGIAIGSDSVFVVDLWNSRIQKFSRGGTFLAQWGSQGTGDGQFSSPSSVAAAFDGSVYVTDSSNNRIQKFNGDGTFQAKWGVRGSGNGQFNNPTGIAVTAEGLIYVIDTYNGRVQKFDRAGNFLTKWGMQSSEEREFIAPRGIAAGPDGSIYVADTGNHRIQKFGSTGDFILQWGNQGVGEGQFSSPSGIVAGADGSVYVADAGNNRIQKFNSEGHSIAQWGSFGVENGRFDYPLGIALGVEGSIYVADTNNNRIQKFDQNGNFITAWGNPGSGSGQFNYPGGIAVGPDGLVYVADTWNHQIQVFDSGGNFIRQWGSLGSEDGQISSPYDLTAGADGSIYVADTGNHRIQKFDSKGSFIAQWGSPDDGGEPFYYPAGVAVGENGSVYAADTWNNRIQKMAEGEMDQVLFEAVLPIDQPANTASDQTIDVGALNVKGKLYLQATLTNNLGQVMAEDRYPFYIYAGETLLSFSTDKKYYSPGEPVTITGEVQNRALSTAGDLTFSLSARQGNQISSLLDTGVFSLPAGGTRSFTVTSVAEEEGLITLTGKVIQNNSLAVEITDQFEVVRPAILASVIAPDAVGSDPFDIHLYFKNEGKIEGTINVEVQVQGGLEDSQTVTVPAGETRFLHYTGQIREDADYIFTFTGDLEQIINKRVSYGLAAFLAMNPQAVYHEGSVGLPLTITNTGPLAGTVEVIFKLYSPPSSPLPFKEDRKVYYLEPAESLTEIIYFNLAEGDYQLVAASQAPVVNGQARFSVRKENSVDLGILPGIQEGGTIPVGVILSNSGSNDLSGRVSVRVSDGSQVIWESLQSLAQLTPQNSHLMTFHIDPSILRPGDYILTAEFFDNGGQTVGLYSSSLSIREPAFQIIQLPSFQAFDPGQEANFTFRVKNTGNQPGELEFHFKSYDRIDMTRREWLNAGEEKTLDFAFALPEDWEEKDYFGDYEIKGGTKGQVKYHLAGINLTVLASLDKSFYNEGGSASLSLSVSTLNSISHSLFARVNYSGYEAVQPFVLNGNRSLFFDIPLPKITGEKLFFGIYQESGRSIHLNSLYLYKAGEVLTLETDKQVYQPGDAVTVRVSSLQGVNGNLTLSAPGYEKSLAFPGSAQEIFVLPAGMTAGTYYVEYQLSTADGQQYTGSHPFDVEGIQVKVKEARLDKGKYAPEDAITLNLTIESNQDLGATLKTWILDPEKNFDSAGTQPILLSRAQPLLAVHTAPFSTAKLGVHRMVYGIYKEERLLCSGSYGFDVGEAILLGISTDKAAYPQGNEPITVEARVRGTGSGNLEFSVDGQLAGSYPVSLSGFSSIQYNLPAAPPGLHTLEVSLVSDGLTSTRRTNFIYGSSLPDLSVRMASNLYKMKDGILDILITVTNRGKSASSPTTLSLYDGGDPVANFEVQSLRPGESQGFTFSLNVSGRAGTNNLQGRVDPANQVDEYSKGNNEAGLTLTVPDLTLMTSLEKSVYAPGETIEVTSLITNLSLDSLSALTLTTEVTDAAGLRVFNHTQTLPTLEKATTFPIQAFWLTETSLGEGIYNISQAIEGKVTARSSVSVKLTDFARGLEGTIGAQPNPIHQGGRGTLSYTLMNKGSADLSGLMVEAMLVNPDTGEIRNISERLVDLPLNETLSDSIPFATADWAPRVYNIYLQVSSPVFPVAKILGSVSFEVKPVLPMVTWGKNFGGGGNGVVYALRQTLDGGYLAAGATSSFFQLIRDAWVSKLDPKGEIQWQKTYGTAAGDAVYTVHPTADGGYVIAGETYRILGIGRQIWVCKLDVDGEVQWQKTYGFGWARSIRQTHEGGYIVAGGREEHAWVMKLDEKGAILWQKGYGSPGDAVYSVQETADGGYVLAGTTGSEEFKSAWAGKLDSEGKVQWQKVYGTGHGEAAYSIQQLYDGGYILAGATNSPADGKCDAWVLKLDPYGGILWQKAYGGQQVDVAYSIGQTTDDGFVLAGVTNSFGQGDYDAWVLRLDPQGAIRWQKAYGAQHGDAAFAAEQAQDGGFIVAGGTNSFVDRDYDVWVWKVDGEGNLSDCQEGWMKNTDGLARETQAMVQDGPMVGQDTFGLAREGKASTREIPGSVIDLCAGIPDISVNPSSRLLAFSWVKAGKSSTKTISVSNLGTGDLGIESVKVNGTAFSQRNDCTVLPPQHSCTIAVTFKPTTPGLKAGLLEISSSDPDENTVRFALSGTGY